MTTDDHKTGYYTASTTIPLDANQKLILQNLDTPSQISLLTLVRKAKILEENKDSNKTFFFGTPLFFQHCNQYCFDFIELQYIFFSLSNPYVLKLTMSFLTRKKLIDAKFSAKKSLWEVSVSVPLEHTEYALVQLLSGKLSQSPSIDGSLLDQALRKLALF